MAATIKKRTNPAAQWFRLVSGKTTTDKKKYLRSWYRIMNPVAKELDLVVHSFDPSVALVTKDYRLTTHMPLWFVTKLQTKMKELQALRKQSKKLQGIYKRSKTI